MWWRRVDWLAAGIALLAAMALWCLAVALINHFWMHL